MNYGPNDLPEGCVPGTLVIDKSSHWGRKDDANAEEAT